MSVFSQWRSRDRPFSFPCIRTGGNISLQMDAAFFVPAVVGMAVLQAFYGEVVSCFYFYFLSTCFASFNVYIFPAFHGQSIFGGDGASCMGYYLFFHIPLDFPALMPTFWSPPIPKDAVIPAPLLLLFPSVVFLFPWRCCLFCRCFCPM